jgi:predicted ATPase
MKIDIHTHTRKLKQGDPATREISPVEFCEKITATDVRIVAITNHNHFDLPQFQAIQQQMPSGIQVWPGIELDIADGASRGHLLVIVSPSQANDFSEAVLRLTLSESPDTFCAPISAVLASLDHLGPLYVAHYRQKKPGLSDGAIAELIAGTAVRSRVLKEVTNAISAGIYIAHGHASIYGSDVQDWATYEETARDLPELRLPVDTFEHFCLLLDKDATAINTLLERKTPEELVLQPFEDGSFLKLTFYDDINVIFGAKGTGKSCILTAIQKYYASNGIKATLFESGSENLNEICDLRGRDLRVDLSSYGIEDGTDAIEAIRAAKEEDITPLSKYIQFFSTTTTNRNAKRLRLTGLDYQEEGDFKRAFQEAKRSADEAARFLGFLQDTPAVRDELEPGELSALEGLVTSLLERLRARMWRTFSALKEVELLNSAVSSLSAEVTRKTGNPEKPSLTGFRRYGANRCEIERRAGSLLRSLATALPIETEVIGSLGKNKGELRLRTEVKFQDGSVWDGSFMPLGKATKAPQKEFALALHAVHRQVYREDLFERIAELNEIEGGEAIRSLGDLLLFNRRYLLGAEPYVPSSGEAAMVLLERELKRDADIFIIDEPEKSWGNEYISEVIVPIIKGHALAGKRLFISTHDANIAVRTLPYCSVYRRHDAGGYKTYVGNPFSNHLVNVGDESDTLDWRVVSMRTLEGGEQAFGERGRIYGQP